MSKQAIHDAADEIMRHASFETARLDTDDARQALREVQIRIHAMLAGKPRDNRPLVVTGQGQYRRVITPEDAIPTRKRGAQINKVA